MNSVLKLGPKDPLHSILWFGYLSNSITDLSRFEQFKAVES